MEVGVEEVEVVTMEVEELAVVVEVKTQQPENWTKLNIITKMLKIHKYNY